MKPEQYIAAEAEFSRLAREMLACIVRLIEAKGPATAPPDIPDAPDVPNAAEVPQPTDAEFLGQLGAAFATAASEAELAEHAEANKAEIERRGIEQAANDLIEQRRQSIRAIAARAAKQAEADHPSMQDTYTGIVTGMRKAETADALAKAWKAAQPALREMPAKWIEAATLVKDKRKKILTQAQAT